MSQTTTSFQPVYTFCEAVGPPLFFNSTNTTAATSDSQPSNLTASNLGYNYTAPSGPNTTSLSCYTVYQPVPTPVCNTVLTGIATAYTVTACGQIITYSSDYGYSLVVPTASGLNATVTPTPYIETATTYYGAPWQELTAGATPTFLDVEACTPVPGVVNPLNGAPVETCVRYDQYLTSTTLTAVSTITSPLSIHTTISGPGYVIVDDYTGLVTEVETSFSYETTLTRATYAVSVVMIPAPTATTTAQTVFQTLELVQVTSALPGGGSIVTQITTTLPDGGFVSDVPEPTQYYETPATTTSFSTDFVSDVPEPTQYYETPATTTSLSTEFISDIPEPTQYYETPATTSGSAIFLTDVPEPTQYYTASTEAASDDDTTTSTQTSFQTVYSGTSTLTLSPTLGSAIPTSVAPAVPPAPVLEQDDIASGTMVMEVAGVMSGLVSPSGPTAGPTEGAPAPTLGAGTAARIPVAGMGGPNVPGAGAVLGTSATTMLVSATSASTVVTSLVGPTATDAVGATTGMRRWLFGL